MIKTTHGTFRLDRFPPTDDSATLAVTFRFMDPITLSGEGMYAAGDKLSKLIALECLSLFRSASYQKIREKTDARNLFSGKPRRD